MTVATTAPMSQTALLLELESVVATNLDRHLAVAKEWFPHEYVPWSDGRTSTARWAARRGRRGLAAAGRGAYRADRQPAHRGQPALVPPPDRDVFGRDGAWGTWVRRWTAEEGRHGIAIRDYLPSPAPWTRWRSSGPG